jgi:hypothetical protein
MTWFIAIQLLEMDLNDLIIDALKNPGGYLTEEGVDMDYGVHLPLISFDGEPFTLVCIQTCGGTEGIFLACCGRTATT